ncbi:sulfite oxidase heme-binding subunit YedZ [Hoeflea poritis]|uniref:Ferric reductase-like transmembrane domain-containing protein n=1 Tax=Hoeflea poritis TaxID=2993659 RepID=A0ABT4VJ67_9HYPH|nr:ferric reductase-like transmembrane domain-containing protein [Hoeflea poritis]MDA4844756.1 ferric reductase-like transmembrane domain-containing protein [Hoeflea poritis]
MLKRTLNSRYFFWAILTLPAIPMVLALAGGEAAPDGRPVTEVLLHPTGEFAARFMIIAMLVTPLRMLFPKAGFLIWLARRRRYLGVAVFAYALFHTILYVVDMGSLQLILAEITALGIWTGWAAFALFIVLAATSNDASQRTLLLWWKRLQRLVYPAAVLTLLHWIFIHNNLGPALVHFVPLALLEIYRIWRTYNPPRPAAPAGPVEIN